MKGCQANGGKCDNDLFALITFCKCEYVTQPGDIRVCFDHYKELARMYEATSTKKPLST